MSGREKRSEGIDESSTSEEARNPSSLASSEKSSPRRVSDPSGSAAKRRRSSRTLENERKSLLKANFAQVASSAQSEVAGKTKNDKLNSLSRRTWKDRLRYVLENKISANSFFPFMILAIFTGIFIFSFGTLWHFQAKKVAEAEGIGYPLYGVESWSDSVFMNLQLIISSGFDTSIPDQGGLRYVYFTTIFFGLVIFAVLVGFITENVQQSMQELARGLTKVSDSDHTLLLGWNEATLRVVCQIAFVRRQYQILNETKCWSSVPFFPQIQFPNLLYFTPTFICEGLGVLERPSTTLAKNDIVIMCDTRTKEEMHNQLSSALAERGIKPKRTRLGQNVICRVGSPTNVNDLIRAGAHTAAAIVVMLTEEDIREEDASDGNIQNGATLKCCLALRHVLFTNAYSKHFDLHPDLRIVLQMTCPSEYVDAAMFTHPNGADIIIPLDLSIFLNTLLFSCAAQPGLGKVILDFLNFEGNCIRRRKAKNLRSGIQKKHGDCIGKTFGEVRLQFTKAVFVGIVRPGLSAAESRRRGLGLCPLSDTIIEPDDLLIFIGPKSNPECNPEMIDLFHSYVKRATELKLKYPEVEEMRDKVAETGELSIATSDSRRVLVCGWRPIWEDHPARFRNRIIDIVKHLSPGSTIIFLNEVERGDFTELMELIGASEDMQKLETPAEGDTTETVTQDQEFTTELKLNSKKHQTSMEKFSIATQDYKLSFPYDNVTIRHNYGDSAIPAILEPIIFEQTINTVIVLGTEGNMRLTPSSRDTRVLNIMLMLRKLWNAKDEGVPMHIVGENQEDMTARLALAPRRLHQQGSSTLLTSRRRKKVAPDPTVNFVSHDPDFVNSQAVFARFIVQTLAYPLIQPAIKELFEEKRGYCNVCIVKASFYVPLGLNLPFGVIRACVLQAKGERSYCIGYIPALSGEVILLPPHDKEIPMGPNDRLVLMKKTLLSLEEDENETEDAD